MNLALAGWRRTSSASFCARLLQRLEDAEADGAARPRADERRAEAAVQRADPALRVHLRRDVHYARLALGDRDAHAQRVERVREERRGEERRVPRPEARGERAPSAARRPASRAAAPRAARRRGKKEYTLSAPSAAALRRSPPSSRGRGRRSRRRRAGCAAPIGLYGMEGRVHLPDPLRVAAAGRFGVAAGGLSAPVVQPASRLGEFAVARGRRPGSSAVLGLRGSDRPCVDAEPRGAVRGSAFSQRRRARPRSRAAFLGILHYSGL